MFDFNNKVEKLFIKASLCFEATESTSRFPRRLRSAINKAQRFVNSAPAKAFTMAEAIIVMTILGIIATIVITNLKPSEFRDKGLQVMARKDIEQIDSAIQQILNNHSQDGTLEKLYELGTTTTFNYFTNPDKADVLLKKYLVTTRNNGFDINGDGRVNGNDSVLLLQKGNDLAGNIAIKISSGTALCYSLKDGADICMPEDPNSSAALFPGETESCTTSSALGFIFIDVTGVKNEPNILGKDVFVLPLDKKGIAYDMACD